MHGVAERVCKTGVRMPGAFQPCGSGPAQTAPPGGKTTGQLEAFTLLELLTVMAVLGVLAALLLPALGSARHRAQSVACLNNLRQWGLATQLYAADHQDFLPPEGSPNPTDSSTNWGWYIQLPRVLDLPRYHEQPWRTNPALAPGRSVWICPANPRRSNGRNLFHYCLNEHVNGTGDENRPVRLGSIPEPGRTVWLFDSKNLPAVGFWNYVHTNLHQGGAQFVFLDGHTRRLPRRAYWDATSNQPAREAPELRWIP